MLCDRGTSAIRFRDGDDCQLETGASAASPPLEIRGSSPSAGMARIPGDCKASIALSDALGKKPALPCAVERRGHDFGCDLLGRVDESMIIAF